MKSHYLCFITALLALSISACSPYAEYDGIKPVTLPINLKELNKPMSFDVSSPKKYAYYISLDFYPSKEVKEIVYDPKRRDQDINETDLQALFKKYDWYTPAAFKVRIVNKLTQKVTFEKLVKNPDSNAKSGGRYANLFFGDLSPGDYTVQVTPTYIHPKLQEFYTEITFSIRYLK